MTSLPLQNKVAVVTGASRGLGAGMALELASRGASILLTYTSPTSLPLVDALRSRIRTPSHAVRVDLSTPSAAATVLSALDAWLGPDSHVHILVNNAAVEVVKPLGTITISDYETVFDLNVRGPLLLTQGLLPRFDPAGKNRIINIGSVGARCGFAQLGLYCSSKAALEGLTRCWAAELGRDGTTVNQVNPGPVQTAMLENIPREIVDGQKARTPVGNRVGTVEEVARIVAWLAGEESSWVSGQVVSASGGLEMY
ncbi:dehydrogenase with different specificitie [Cercophora newfieldiana]|uniref:Dehydrogenase with different specificitie n=1 Tax=Cercophora newfieldiana TaxID=92897 RepID=A0AA39Y240_9PEZI|nr:dehydrogenase with different specificitie [Cercophora newfieldiana]